MRLLGHSLAAVSAIAVAPLALGVMAARPAWRIGVRERLGAQMRIPPGSIWVHAASVGEIRLFDESSDRIGGLVGWRVGQRLSTADIAVAGLRSIRNNAERQ